MSTNDPDAYRLSDKPNPYGECAGKLQLCSLCRELYTDERILDSNGLCPECKGKIRRLVDERLKSLGMRIPNILPICSELSDTLEAYKNSGVPEDAVDKYKQWVADKAWELLHYNDELEDAVVESYRKNSVLPVVYLLDEHPEYQNG